MNMTPNYGTTAAYNGNPERLPAGGYICRILKAWCETIPTGSEQLVLALEISEGKYAGAMKRQFDARKTSNANANWPCLYKRFTLDTSGQTNPWFKGMITSVEESNAGYKWDWHEESLKGKLVGIVFRDEEFEANDGTIKVTTRPAYACSVQRVRDGVEAPEVKRLNRNTSSTHGASGGFQGVVNDDDLPF